MHENYPGEGMVEVGYVLLIPLDYLLNGHPRPVGDRPRAIRDTTIQQESMLPHFDYRSKSND